MAVAAEVAVAEAEAEAEAAALGHREVPEHGGDVSVALVVIAPPERA